MKQLQDECRRVQLSARDDAERYARIHRDRFFRTWTDPDGAFCGRFATTPAVGAKMAAVLAKAADRRFNEARNADDQEPLQAYAMDALASVVCGDDAATNGTKLVINAVVDYQTLMSDPGEGGTCEVAGLGPVPVATIHEWEGDRYLRLLVRDGIDIRTVTRTTRFIDQRQRAALLARQGLTCCIQDCDRAARLEIDHHQRVADGGLTDTANLWPKCHFHHRLKDLYGWKLVGGPGHWRLEPP